MSLLVNISNTWKNIKYGYINVNNTWKKIKNIYTNVNGVWKPLWKYSWSIGNWSVCSAECGGGTQTRTVYCKRNDNEQVDDVFCSETTKPVTSQTCNTQSCGGNWPIGFYEYSSSKNSSIFYIDANNQLQTLSHAYVPSFFINRRAFGYSLNGDYTSVTECYLSDSPGVYTTYKVSLPSGTTLSIPYIHYVHDRYILFGGFDGFYYSKDLITWNYVFVEQDDSNGVICFGSNNGLGEESGCGMSYVNGVWVLEKNYAFKKVGTIKYYYSTDGIHFSRTYPENVINIPVTGGGLTYPSIYSINNLFIAVCGNYSYFKFGISVDGVNWIEKSYVNMGSSEYTTIVYLNNCYIKTSLGWLYSTDLVNWARVTSLKGTSATSNTTLKKVIFGIYGGTTYIATSPTAYSQTATLPNCSETVPFFISCE